MIQNQQRSSQSTSNRNVLKDDQKYQNYRSQLDNKNKKNFEQKNLKKNLNIKLTRKDKTDVLPEFVIDLKQGQFLSKISSARKHKQAISQTLGFGQQKIKNHDISITAKNKTSNSYKNMINQNYSKNIGTQYQLLHQQNELLKKQNAYLKKKIQTLQSKIKQIDSYKIQIELILQQKSEIDNKYRAIRQSHEQMVIKIKNLYEELIKQKKKHQQIRDFIMNISSSDNSRAIQTNYIKQTGFKSQLQKSTDSKFEYYKSMRQKQYKMKKSNMEPDRL